MVIPSAEDELSDADLVRAIAAGGAAAARQEAAFCKRFGPRVRLYGLRHLHSEARAADLSQRVLMTTIVKMRSGAVAEPEKIASFVLGMARLMSREDGRQARREQPHDTDSFEDLAYMGDEPDVFARDRLPDCLQALPERERTLLVMTFFEQQDADGIAETLRVTGANVRVMRHRALNRLRSCLGLGPDPQPEAS